MCEQHDKTPKSQPGSRRLQWEPGEGKGQGCGQQGKGRGSAVQSQNVGAGEVTWEGGRPLAAPAPHLASSLLLHQPLPWFSVSGWDNPRPLRGTVWPLINLGANPPFKPFPVNAKVGHYDLKYSSAHCPSTSFLNFGTLSCLCCWGTCYFFRDRAGSLVILALIGDKVQSKN